MILRVNSLEEEVMNDPRKKYSSTFPTTEGKKGDIMRMYKNYL